MELNDGLDLYSHAYGKRTVQKIAYNAIPWKGDYTTLGGPNIEKPFEYTAKLRGRGNSFISYENDRFNFGLQNIWYNGLSHKDKNKVILAYGDIVNADPTSIMEIDLEHSIEEEYIDLQHLFVNQRDNVQGSKAFMFHVTARGTTSVENGLIPRINDLLGTKLSLFAKGNICDNEDNVRGREYLLRGQSGEYCVKMWSYRDRATMITCLILYGDAPPSNNNSER